MGLASITVYATLLACIVVGVTATNPTIGDKNTPTRGSSELGDSKPQQLFYRKLLERYNIRDPVEHSSIGDSQAEKLRRRLAQFINNESPVAEQGSPSPSTEFNGAPGPAPGPQGEFSPAPGPYNPFIPPSNDSNLACCCRTAATYYEEPYQDPAPPGCCCGSRNSCCPQGSLISIVCGGGQVCGILMLLSALIAVLVLTVCMTGTFYARRRRQQLLAMHAAAGGGPNGAIGGVGSFRPAEQITIAEAEIPGLRVKYGVKEVGTATVEEGGDSDGTGDDTGGGTTKECPICLDTVSLHSDTWAVFPCTHGCCRPCFSDLLRHSSRRVNNSAVFAVMCPLCRKLAVAPDGETMPSSPSAIQGTAAVDRAVAAEAGGEGVVVTPIVEAVVEVDTINNGQQGQNQGGGDASPQQLPRP